MRNPRAFISFDFDNNEGEKKYFVGQSINSKTPFKIEDWSAKAAMPQNQWEKIVEDKIKRCNFVIVLIGRQISSAIGVKKEIEMAKRNNVPVFGVYVDGANSSSRLPEGLLRSQVISWKWDLIASKINEMMLEGKNI